MPVDVPLGPIILAAFSVSALSVSDWRQWRTGRYLFKPLSALAFLWLAASAGAMDTSYGRWLLAGLAASALGDLLLMPDNRFTFLAGLVAFLCGTIGASHEKKMTSTLPQSARCRPWRLLSWQRAGCSRTSTH